jgi:hypothetical protein
VRRRRRAFEWPPGLGRFNPDDWQEWMLDGPDPAADAYKIPLEEFYAMPHETTQLAGYSNGEEILRTVTVGIGDKPPEVIAVWRWIDAHRRWTEARVGGLKQNGYEWLDVWLDGIRAEHRKREELRTTRSRRAGGV